MKSQFDSTQLEKLLRDYYFVTQIRITVFDGEFNEICGYPEQRADFCQFIRRNKDVDYACSQCDKRSCQIASRMRFPYIYKCHAGLTEIIYPLIIGDVTIGYLFFAHIFSFDSFEEGLQSITNRLSKYHFNPTDLSHLLSLLPIKSKEYINAAANMLQAVAYYLGVQHFAYLKQENLPIRIDNYIKANLSHDLSADKICEVFGIGKTTLYSVTKKIYSHGLASYIRTLRINKAKELLLSNVSIIKVAEQCGFYDYNYFIALFRKEVGISPKKFSRAPYSDL